MKLIYPKLLCLIVLSLCLAGAGLLPDALLAESTVNSSDEGGLYTADPEPLLPVECGQCHTKHYYDLKNDGGNHRFACQDCHEIIHAYNPRKNNYDEIMPKCNQCHDQPHGTKIVDCLTCHSNPHTPKQIPANELLADICSECHSGPAKQLKENPSAHTEQGCQSCHYERHGYIPSCFDCHEGHIEDQAVETCANCHQEVHMPLQIKLAVDSDVKTCGACHETVYAKWENTPSKHGDVSCGMCHEQHGQIPECSQCHVEPHDRRQLEMFPNCLTCHLDVHDLPVKR